MTIHRILLVLAGAASTAVIAFASSMAQGSALTGVSMHGATPLWLKMLVCLWITYGLGMLLGSALWNRGR